VGGVARRAVSGDPREARRAGAAGAPRALALEVTGIARRFGGVQALAGVSLSVPAGACHALMGENGAGKSTLAKIVAGILRPDAGTLAVGGRPCDFRSPADALAAGVALVHQEQAACRELSVAENLCLGRWPRRGRAGRSGGPTPAGSGAGRPARMPWRWSWPALVDGRAMRSQAQQLLAVVGATLDVDAPMRTLSPAQEQLVQIAAAVGTGARVLLLDEPTSALSAAESEQLFRLMGRLRAEGVTLVYVSHRIPEVLALCDTIHVLRDGVLAGSLERGEADEATLVQLMIGRPLQARVPRPAPGAPGEVLLEARGLSTPAGVRAVDLTLRAGEIVGLAGLVGAGRSALLGALFGLDRQARGELRVAGRPLRLGSVRRAQAAGLGLVPEDRQRQGLVPFMSVVANHSLASLRALRRGPLLDVRAERAQAVSALERLQVRAPSLAAPVAVLSGGNQQKVVLSRWLRPSTRVLLVDEPTRGVDVGAKAAIHALLQEHAAAGAAVLLASSDLPELLALSHRVLVMRAGRVVAGFPQQDARPEAVLAAMADLAPAGPQGGRPAPGGDGARG